jgi:hypothetical protein
MSKNQKIIWGVLAIIPWIWFLAVVIFQFIFPDTFPEPEKYRFLIEYWYLISIIALMIIWVMFIYHVKKNKFIPEEKRTLWIWIVVFGNMYVYPVYWWHYVRNAT